MKNQLKKSLSLLMAVLMILSCWVWVAPDKAEAAGSYTVLFDVSIANAHDGNKDGNYIEIWYYTYDANGNLNVSGSKKTTNVFSTVADKSYAIDVPGWPYKITMQTEAQAEAAGGEVEVKLNRISINGYTILQGTYTFSSSGYAWNGHPDSKTWTWSNNKATGDIGSPKVNDWPKPELKTLTSMQSTPVTVNGFPSTTAVTSDVTVTGGLDQYGVEYIGKKPESGYTHSLYYVNDNGERVDLKSGNAYANIVSTTDGKNPVSVSITPQIQNLFPAYSYNDIFLESSYSKDPEVKVITPIRVNMPRYYAYFHPNGGTIGTSKNNLVTGSDYITYGLGSKGLYYGSIIGTAPSYSDRSREGFELAGYYDQAHEPKLGLDETFAGTRFENGVTTVGAGGNSNWYAAWKAKTYTATFMVGNQLFGTLSAKHKNSMIGEGMYGGVSDINGRLAAAYRNSGKDAIKFESAYSNNPVLNGNSFVGWRLRTAEGGGLDTIITGDVVFEAQFAPKDVAEKKYNVTFYNANGTVARADEYSFRDFALVPETDPELAADVQYEYTFIGWTKNIGTKYYTVDAEGKDKNGAYISYMPKETAEFVVTDNAEYVPVFRMIPIEYTVTFVYKGQNGVQAEPVTVGGYHYGDSIAVSENVVDNYTNAGKRYFINGWKIGNTTYDTSFTGATVTGNMRFTAQYDAGNTAVYTINFYDKDGNLLNAESNQYNHRKPVTAPTVGDVKEGDDTTYDIPFTIDTEDSLYTFKGWNPAVNTTATADVDYKADYLQKDYADVCFYNYDGTLLYKIDGKEEGLFKDDVIPEYPYELPVRPDDVRATYEFTGWKNANGESVLPGSDKLTGDVYLTAQFNPTAKKYTVLFLNGDEVVSRQELEYGEPLTQVTTPVKNADKYYSYSFKTWEPAVSEVCYGDATYNATFRRSAILYDIYWLAEDIVSTPIRHSRYASGARIQAANAPAESLLKDDAAVGYIWAFKEWVRCDEYGNPLDAEGNKVSEENALRFERGMTMPEETLYFYPLYKLSATNCIVEFFEEDGVTSIGKASIPFDEEINEYSAGFIEDTVKNYDEEYHYTFAKWVKLDDSELPKNENGEYIVDNTVTQVKASYTKGAHKFEPYETIIAPTCTETGVVEMKCSSEHCQIPSYLDTVSVIPDIAAPTAQVYIGLRKWTMSDFSNDNINYNEKVYVGANSTTIVNAEDLGSQSKLNPFAKLSRGVGKIEYYISDKVISNPATQISEWTTIYNYNNVYNEVLDTVLKDMGYTLDQYDDIGFGIDNSLKAEIDSEVKAILATYKANATGILGELGLENGKEYIIYFRISDRAVEDDVNISYMSTGKLHYGTQAATITVSGNGYGSKFCADARIAIADDTDGFEIYLDDEKLNISATATSVTGSSSTSFVCDEIGVHTITVIDKNGNRSSKTFEIKGGHTFRNYTVAASCENDGSRYDLCTVCGIKANVQTLTKLGHNYKTYTEKAPTCTVYGSRTYVCDNNCGEKLVVSYNTDTSAWVNLAEAKLKAEDVKHLEATGEHTYPMVIGADGKETTEEAWVIDKAATCMVAGSKHRDCTKCGYRETVTINIDPDAHKYYRARVEDDNKPTCTEQGKKTETCRYCGYENFVEYVAALGHTAGKYKVTNEATCETEGSKILTCAVCKDADGKPTVIGEPVEDADGNVTFNGQAVVIPATGHAYKAVNDPVYNETDGKWYQHYVCNNDANHTKDEETEHEEKVSATVTFVSESTTVGTFTKYVGETIVAADVTAPTKAADETYKYTFSHWEDESGKEVSFPITVAEEGATYTAVFAKKNVKYTVTYLNENGTQYKKVGYLNNLTEVKLEKGPAKAETVYKEFAFAGWAKKVETVVKEPVKDAEGNEVIDAEGNVTTVDKIVVKYELVGNTVNIDGENIVLYATYTSTPRVYAVTYAYKLSDTIITVFANAGSEAPGCGLVPEKAADSKYHYTFSGWNRANQLAAVTSNIYTTPNFTAVAHDLKVDADSVVPATCTSNRIEKKVCACGYETAAAEVKNTMLGHNWSENAEYDATSGKYIRKCQNQGCTATTADTRTFTLSFYYETPANETVKPNREVNNIAWGTSVDTSRLPAAPEKDADDQYIYTFKGWKLKGAADDKLEDITKLVIKQDYEFVAVFDKAEREYTVTFAYEYSHKPIESYTVKYGMGKNFTGADPEKKNDTDPNYDPENYHYTFSGWSEKTDRITKDTVVYAKFTKAEHTYGDPVETGPATCQQGTGYKYTCTLSTCKHEKFETGKPLDHNLEIIESVAATPDKDGYIIKQCTYVYDGKRCEYTEKEDVKYEDSTIKIVVTVDRDGAPASGIKVITHAVGEDTMMNATTNAYGVATIVVAKDKSYVAYVVIDGKEILVPLATDAKGNFVGAYSIVTNNNNNSGDADCGCACHRDNFWGSIFRFFHKIIKLFTGEFKCCGNPDPMYG